MTSNLQEAILLKQNGPSACVRKLTKNHDRLLEKVEQQNPDGSITYLPYACLFYEVIDSEQKLVD